MDRNTFISRVEEVCELPPQTLNGSESLRESMLIDSLSLLGLVSMFDKSFKINLTINEIMSADSLDCLYNRVVARQCLH